MRLGSNLGDEIICLLQKGRLRKDVYFFHDLINTLLKTQGVYKTDPVDTLEGCTHYLNELFSIDTDYNALTTLLNLMKKSNCL